MTDEQHKASELVIVKLSADEANFLKQAVENSTVKGIDAPIIANLLKKLQGAWSRAVDKSNGQ